MSNEIVANGGLNGSFATTADGLKLDNVPVIVQPGQAVGTYWIGFRVRSYSGFEMQVGLNAYALYKGFNDAICYISEGRY
jgi:molybdopterin-containing oxidoreductase family iron-sulfur binding subunit